MKTLPVPVEAAGAGMGPAAIVQVAGAEATEGLAGDPLGREALARASGITVSARPCARKIGRPALALLRSAAVVSASGR